LYTKILLREYADSRNPICGRNRRTEQKEESTGDKIKRF
jgi:hypothetical protein